MKKWEKPEINSVGNGFMSKEKPEVLRGRGGEGGGWEVQSVVEPLRLSLQTSPLPSFSQVKSFCSQPQKYASREKAI